MADLVQEDRVGESSRPGPSTPARTTLPTTPRSHRSVRSQSGLHDFSLKSPHYLGPSPYVRDLYGRPTEQGWNETMAEMTAEERAKEERKRRRRLMRSIAAERARIETVQEELERVKRQKVEEMRSAGNVMDAMTRHAGQVMGISAVGIEEEQEGLESLEAILRQMDDGALSALLVHDGQPIDLDALMAHLPPPDRPSIPAPARSAGVEGTGAGWQVDREEDQLDKVHTDSQLDRQLETVLRGRLKRVEELTSALARFTGLEADHVESTREAAFSSYNKEQGTEGLRHVIIQGRLSGDLGPISISMDVTDRPIQSTPQIVALDVDLHDALFQCIGANRLITWVKEVHLPAILLAIRTSITLAMARFRLFCTLCRLYEDLAEEQMRRWDALGISRPALQRRGPPGEADRDAEEDQDESEQADALVIPQTPLTMLLNAENMGSIQLRNKRGASLTIDFTIRYSRWGHARPALRLKADIPPRSAVVPEVAQLIDRFPQHFDHLCAHRPAHASVLDVLVATIDAFFAR